MSIEPRAPIEFIGMIQSRRQSEIHPASGPAVDPGYVAAGAQGARGA